MKVSLNGIDMNAPYETLNNSGKKAAFKEGLEVLDKARNLADAFIRADQGPDDKDPASGIFSGTLMVGNDKMCRAYTGEAKFSPDGKDKIEMNVSNAEGEKLNRQVEYKKDGENEEVAVREECFGFADVSRITINKGNCSIYLETDM